MELKRHGRLLLGVPYQNRLHFGFTVKVLSMGGECAALDVIAELGIDGENISTAEQMLIDLAYLGQQLEIEGIPNAALTPQFLLEQLATDDYALVMAEIAELRKKRQDVGEQLSPAASD